MNRPYLLASRAPEGDWATDRRRGCAPGRVDPDVFFPATRSENANAPALAACRWCPVKEPCKQYALDHPGLYGVWGGTTQSERDRIHRIRRVMQP